MNNSDAKGDHLTVVPETMVNCDGHRLICWYSQ